MARKPTMARPKQAAAAAPKADKDEKETDFVKGAGKLAEKIPASMDLLEAGFRGTVLPSYKMREDYPIGVRISDETYEDIMALVEWDKKQFNAFARSAFSAVFAVEMGLNLEDYYTDAQRETALVGVKRKEVFGKDQKFTHAARAQHKAGQARVVRLNYLLNEALKAYCKKYDLTPSTFGRLALEQAVIYAKEKGK